ncbi:uncharacterized protein ARMOST_08739 [Armillaria ostoyae]|uniref:Uncharacterized protein n=1 Tax=Armillaria ostoyae TaxID=47428 RepID=A0A284R9K1_ARMOS|nr:uncharacterized protein ARMOST_08739 [Armillaria ostoyae]
MSARRIGNRHPSYRVYPLSRGYDTAATPTSIFQRGYPSYPSGEVVLVPILPGHNSQVEAHSVVAIYPLDSKPQLDVRLATDPPWKLVSTRRVTKDITHQPNLILEQTATSDTTPFTPDPSLSTRPHHFPPQRRLSSQCPPQFSSFPPTSTVVRQPPWRQYHPTR